MADEGKRNINSRSGRAGVKITQLRHDPPNQPNGMVAMTTMFFRTRTDDRRAILVLAPWVLYAFVFGALHDPLGPKVFALGLIPVAFVGGLTGMRCGLLAGILAVPLNVFLASLAGGPSAAAAMGGEGLGMASLALLGATVGWLHDLAQQPYLARARQQWVEAEADRRLSERASELIEENTHLRQRSELSASFVADVSHELRTPVTNLRLYLGLLDEVVPEKRTQFIGVLTDQCVRLATLIENVLRLSRLEGDKANVDYQRVNLNTLVEQVVVGLQPRAQAAGHLLVFDPSPELAPVLAATSQLDQVVTNLVVNAIKYTAAGLISVSTHCDGTRACLRVTDTGMGIAPDEIEHLFERFYRGTSARQSEVSGTGLGLAIVKEIVELHGGEVTVESRAGEGSTFNVWLPLAAPE